MKAKQLTRFTIQQACVYVFLVFMLANLSGCVSTGTTDLRPFGQGVSVSRLKGGSEGFIIRETPKMSGEAQKNFERAVNLMQNTKYKQAIELLEKVVEQSPGVTAPYINIAMAYVRTGKLDQAEKHLKTALELFPDHPVASNEYGLLLRKSGRFDEARQTYEKTLKRFPEYLPAHRNLGILCDIYLNDQKCALKEYEIYFEAKPEDKQVKMWIADLRMRFGK